jgi:hypothetical protein
VSNALFLKLNVMTVKHKITLSSAVLYADHWITPTAIRRKMVGVRRMKKICQYEDNHLVKIMFKQAHQTMTDMTELYVNYILKYRWLNQ